MYGIDTNVLLRHILQDDETQSRMATEFITMVCSETQPAFINNITLVECVWVLQQGYKYDKEYIVKILRAIATAKEVVFENETIVVAAIGNYQRGTADFADYLIAQINQRHGCTHTATFDKKANHSPHFHLLT